MDFRVNTVSQCANAGHRFFDLTVGGKNIRVSINRDELALDRADVEGAVMDRIKSALKEAGATMALATWKTALEGKDFKA